MCQLSNLASYKLYARIKIYLEHVALSTLYFPLGIRINKVKGRYAISARATEMYDYTKSITN